MNRSLAIAYALALAAPALAQVSKCTDAAGKVTYQQGACPAAATAEAIVNGQRITAQEVEAARVEKQRAIADRKARAEELNTKMSDAEKRDMVRACATFAQASVKFPPSYSQTWPPEGIYPVSVLDDGSAGVVVRYHATNSYGGMVPGQQTCAFKYAKGKWSMDYDYTLSAAASR